jgi:23S rRNA pseudouridine1911/1915/1917 synthase
VTRRRAAARDGAPPAAPPRRLRLDLVVAPQAAGQRLDALLREHLTRALGEAPSKAQVRTLIVAGVVRVDGRCERRAGRVLEAGARLQADVDAARLRARAALERAHGFRVDARSVLYEDDVLIALDKPAGLALHATADARRPHLVALTLEHLARARPAAEPAYLGVHQRLDRETSGVVLFAKHPRANAGLARQFEQHRVEKVYHALVRRPRGRLPEAWSATEDIAGPAGPQRARTDLRVLATLAQVLLIEARPHTGRKHQIRIHLAAAGHPLVGDPLYVDGGLPGPDPALPGEGGYRLHAHRLALDHPATGQRLALECFPPPDLRL